MATRSIVGGSESTLEVALKNGIKAELLRPDKQRPMKNAPVVFKDESGLPNHSHYYVVWNKFEGLDQLIRSSVVYESVKDAFGVEEAMKTVTAMGLTVEEAKEMGFKF